MSELMLTSAQRRALKARAHDLKPVVLLGAAGLTEMVLREIDRALGAHELVKVKVPGDDREQRAAVFSESPKNSMRRRFSQSVRRLCCSDRCHQAKKSSTYRSHRDSPTTEER